jgi:hypothetical protein
VSIHPLMLGIPAREDPVLVPEGHIAIRILTRRSVTGGIADAAVGGYREHLFHACTILVP